MKPENITPFHRIFNSSVASILFGLALIAYMAQAFIRASTLPQVFETLVTVDQVLLYATFFFLTTKIVLFSKYSLWNAIPSVLLIVVGLSSWYFAGLYYLFVLSLFIVGAKDIDFELICNIAWKTALFFLILVIGLCLLGVLENEVILQITSTGQLRTRQAFGFTHQNNIGMLCLVVAAGYIFSKRGNMNMRRCIFLLAMSVLLVICVDSRTGAALIVLGVILWIISEKISSKAAMTISAAICLVSIIVALYVCFNYDNSNFLMREVNEFLSGRPLSASRMIHNYPITMFGQEVVVVDTRSAARLQIEVQNFDCAYPHLIIRYGLIAFFVYVGAYIAAFIRAAMYRQSCLCIIIALMFVAGAAENWFFLPSVGFSLFALFAHLEKESEVAALFLSKRTAKKRRVHELASRGIGTV